jgi:hypothetical protein
MTAVKKKPSVKNKRKIKNANLYLNEEDTEDAELRDLI